MLGTQLMSEPITALDRRTAQRHGIAHRPVRAAVFLGPESITCAIQDLSLGGLALTLHAIVAPGDRLNVELHNSAGQVWLCKSIQVVHAMPRQIDRWLVGCAFAEPLTHVQLRQLLAGSATIAVRR